MKKIYLLLSLIFILPDILGQDYVIISEIMYDTPLNEKIAHSIDYSNGEFIELYNLGDNEVNLTGWKLHGGGATEFYVFNNVRMPPKSSLIFAYQHNDVNTVRLFKFEDLYGYLSTEPKNQIVYQKRIILSNSGEYVKLLDKSGMTKDSIYYHGTSSNPLGKRLSAMNKNGITGRECVSLQRKNVVFDDKLRAITNNEEWITALVTPYQLHPEFTNPLDNIPGHIVNYRYDSNGNIISRKLTFRPKKTRNIETSKFESDTNTKPKIQLKVFPNPTNGILYIEFEDYRENSSIQVSLHNIEGKQYIKKQIFTPSTSIDISSYSEGIYILNINIDGINYNQKVIKK